ncbi:MAG: hypothetical protein K5707_06830 [Clostridia bacterium]|nr:hypothetical protein [Clostridia bacterium]
MAERITNRKVYDSVFTDLFSDPANCLRLYQDLHPKENVRLEDVQVLTLKAVLTNHIYNDLGLQVGDRSLFLM